MSAIPQSIDPVVLLQELGLQVQDIRGDEVWARCPGHFNKVGRIDNDASWSVNIETGEHHCFSCNYGGTIWGLIAYINGWYTEQKFGVRGGGQLDIRRAEKWLAKRGGESFDRGRKLKTTAAAFIRPTKRKTMDEARLALFVDPPDWAMSSRGVDDSSVTHYGVRWDEDYQAWVLPIRDPATGKLWGWQLKGEEVFRNRPPGVKKSEALFGFEKLTSDTAVLLESPLDCLRLRSVGVPNAVSSYGAGWTDKQLMLLRSRTDKLIVAFDNPLIDTAGRNAALRVMGLDSKGKRSGEKNWSTQFTMSFFNYANDAKDPGDMNAADILYGIDNARSSVYAAQAL